MDHWSHWRNGWYGPGTMQHYELKPNFAKIWKCSVKWGLENSIFLKIFPIGECYWRKNSPLKLKENSERAKSLNNAKEYWNINCEINIKTGTLLVKLLYFWWKQMQSAPIGDTFPIRAEYFTTPYKNDSSKHERKHKALLQTILRKKFIKYVGKYSRGETVSRHTKQELNFSQD